ncbi:MAG: hypothetical protein KDA89_18390, partial [Planctomycetaceae bacterium]|nr:hypothetical protein [Planctomycetaceae bacterium]
MSNSPQQLPGRDIVSGVKCAPVLWAAATVIAIAGCADQAATKQLSVADFSTWVVPADGTRIPAPRALYTDNADTVYALDDAGRLLVYSSDGSLVQSRHMPEHENGRPEGVVKLADGRIAVADTHYHRIVFFYEDGSVESMLGEKGTDAGQFVYPVAIT